MYVGMWATVWQNLLTDQTFLKIHYYVKVRSTTERHHFFIADLMAMIEAKECGFSQTDVHTCASIRVQGQTARCCNTIKVWWLYFVICSLTNLTMVQRSHVFTCCITMIPQRVPAERRASLLTFHSKLEDPTMLAAQPVEMEKQPILQ